MSLEDKTLTKILSEQLRIGTGIDFHSLHENHPLVLGGVRIPSSKGFNVKRSDGDTVSHAIVDALLAALGKGDIADWFSDQDGVTHAASISYLGEIYERLLDPHKVIIINLQVVVLAEEPKLKPFFQQMKENIAGQLRIDRDRISIQGKTFEGKGTIGTQQGIETHVSVALLKRESDTP